MICKNCNSQVNDNDKFCHQCGSELTGSDADNSQAGWIKDLKDKWKEEPSWINSYREKLRKIENAYRTGFDKSDTKALYETVTDSNQRQSLVDELKAMVFSNPHVTRNHAYDEKVKITGCYYDKDNMKVNACAGINKHTRQPEILLYDGYINFLFAVEAIFSSRSFDEFRKLGETLGHNKRNFTSDVFINVRNDLSDKTVKLENVFMSLFETIAHELGHICLDHVLGPGYKGKPLDVSRNQEREADSFASSCIASSSFKDNLFESQIKCCIVRAMIEKADTPVEPHTHPLDLERLKNTIRNNYDLSKEMGIDEEWAEMVFG